MRVHYFHCTPQVDSGFCLFMSGFGFLPQAFAPKKPTIMVYDYSDMDNAHAISHLAHLAQSLIAWSMGVSIASRIIESSALRGKPTLAINGTPLGIDSEYGIHPRLFARTYQKLDTEAFIRGCFGEEYASDRRDMRHILPDDEALIRELRTIESFCATHTLPDTMLPWHEALISERDMIFSPIAQKKAWEAYAQTHAECAIITSSSPHFVFETMDIL